VIFVPSAKTGKPMILDAKSTKGIVLLDAYGHFSPDTMQGEAVAGKVVDTYVDHRMTCPAAAEWKGRTRAGSTGGESR